MDTGNDNLMDTASDAPQGRVIDWASIEIEYRAGIAPLRDIGKRYGVTHGAINKRAKRDKWSRDLQPKIQAKAEELVASAAVSVASRRDGVVTEQDTVDANGRLVAGVQIRHRQTIERTHRVCEDLLTELEQQNFNRLLLEELGEMLRNPNKSGQDRLNEIYHRVISMPGRVETAKKLVEALRIVVELEREAYGMNSKQKEDVPLNPLTTLLQQMRRSVLPVVQEVPRGA